METQVGFGRTHNPFTGDAEIWVHSDNEELKKKILEEITKASEANEVAEIESDGTTMTKRPLRRTISAAVKLALKMFDEGKLTPAQVLASIPATEFNKLLNLVVADVSALTELGRGLAAAPGAACGEVVTSSKQAIERSLLGNKVILVVDQTKPEDMQALELAAAIVNTSGGFTSHSAVVARQLGKPCVVSYEGQQLKGIITVDGSTGKVFAGTANFKETMVEDSTRRLLEIISQVSKLKVFANADTADHVTKAIANGAAGIGLCRTEHTFFSTEGLEVIRKLILAKTDKEKTIALEDVKKSQSKHFYDLFLALGKRPAVIRLLDPPLHEFLPKEDDKQAIKDLSTTLKMKIFDIKTRIKELHEENPMLGHRGVRLGVTFKNLARIQTAAIISAARKVAFQTSGAGPTSVGIMIPLVVSAAETQNIIKEIKTGIEEGKASQSCNQAQDFTIGVMLETPRACITAYELAGVCDFFSFGTNDLTQTVWALSRDDSNKFVPAYIQQGLLVKDPFETLDIDGVGALMSHAVEVLGERRSKMKLGICGEHGGDPASIEFCAKIGLDYVSCSPPRILAARIAAAYASVDLADLPAFAVQDIKLGQPIVVADTKAKEMVTPDPKPTIKKDLSSDKKLSGMVMFSGTSAKELLDKFGGTTIGVDANYLEKDNPLLTEDVCSVKLLGWTQKNNLLVVGVTKGWKNEEKPQDFLLDVSWTKDYKEENGPKFFIPFEAVMYVKQTGFSVNLPKPVAIKKYDPSKQEWTAVIKADDVLELIGWQVTFKDSTAIGLILGATKSVTGKIIVQLDNEQVTTIEATKVVEIAPPGTKSKFPPKVIENVVDVAVNKEEPVKVDLSSLNNLSYEDLAKEIALKSVLITDPNEEALGDKAKKIECKAVGYYPTQQTVKAFIVELPQNVKNPNANNFLNPLAKLFDEGFKTSKQLYAIKFDAVQDVIIPLKVVDLNAVTKEKQ